jgi:hypothetical protein
MVHGQPQWSPRRLCESIPGGSLLFAELYKEKNNDNEREDRNPCG